MLCRRRKTALVPLSLAALVKVVAASECTRTCQDCLATAGCAHAMNDKYWDCMEDLPCLQEAAWNVYSQAEGAEQFDCDVACHGVESPPPPPYQVCNPSRKITRETFSLERSCWDNFAPCYLLWGVAVVYAIWSCQRVERVVREAKNAGEVGAARARWEKAKKCSGAIFAICWFFHFLINWLWMGFPFMWEAIPACFVLGVLVPFLLYKHGDKMFNIVLVDAANPRRLTLANAVAIRNGQQAPLTLASHPGYAICRGFPERRGGYPGGWVLALGCLRNLSHPLAQLVLEWYPNLQLES